MNKDLSLCIVTPNTTGYYCNGIITALYKRMGQRSQLFVLTGRGGKFQNPAALAYADGIVVLLDSAEDVFLKEVMASEKPVVYLDVSNKGHRQVRLNNYLAMRKVTEHLIGHDHRKILFVGNLSQEDTLERLAGFSDAMKNHGLPMREEWVLDCLWNDRDAMKRFFLSYGQDCTAVAAATDHTALSLREILIDFGYRIPEDVAVTGFDNIPEARTAPVSLTTVGYSFDAIAHAILKQLRDFVPGTSSICSQVETELILRSSCGCTNKNADHKPGAVPAEVPENCSKQAISKRMRIVNDQVYFLSDIVKKLMRPNIDQDQILNDLFMMFWDHSACLGLWNSEQSYIPRLQVRKYYCAETLKYHQLELECPPQYFPPDEFIRSGSYKARKNIFIVFEIKSELKPWGLMSLRSSIEYFEWYGYDYTTVFFDALASALERNEIQEFYKRMMSETAKSLPAVSGCAFEWNLPSKTVTLSQPVYTQFEANFLLREQVEGLYRYIHPNDLDSVKPGIQMHLRTGIPLLTRFRMMNAHGQVRWVQVTGEVHRDSAGIPLRVVGFVHDTTEKIAEEQLAHLAYHDTLTGLPNRLLCNQQLINMLNLCSQGQGAFAILFVDLDRLKEVNDVHGHRVGDQLLKFVAKQLSAILPAGAFAARIGGDEFILILRIAEEYEPYRLTEAIMEHFKDTHFFIREKPYFASLSIGVAVYPRDGQSVEMLLDKADNAMYKQKSIHRREYLSAVSEQEV